MSIIKCQIHNPYPLGKLWILNPEPFRNHKLYKPCLTIQTHEILHDNQTQVKPLMLLGSHDSRLLTM